MIIIEGLRDILELCTSDAPQRIVEKIVWHKKNNVL